MSDLQLERSVLEAKERDELFAIALALGASPAARTKKADLVSHILQVTGVEEDATPTAEPPAEKPRRARSRRAGPTASQDNAGESGTEQLELASANGHLLYVAAETTLGTPGRLTTQAHHPLRTACAGDARRPPRSCCRSAAHSAGA